jgi:peptide/nickel transport system permease protein
MNSEARSRGRLRMLMEEDAVFVAAVAFLVLVGAIAILAPLLPIPSYTAMSAARLAPPAPGRWFGTDEFGRDLFGRTVQALRISILVGGLGVAVSTLLGVILGLVTGYFGKLTDAVMMRFLDALLAFPSLLLAIGIAAIVGPGAFGVALALGIVGTPQMARIVRAGTIAERELDYVTAARSIGTPAVLIMIRHILPNILHLVAVQMVLFFVVAVLTEASLSFLGLGIQVPLPSLGSMLDASRDHLTSAPWYALAPGATLTLSVLALNVMADGLRDRLGAQS